MSQSKKAPSLTRTLVVVILLAGVCGFASSLLPGDSNTAFDRIFWGLVTAASLQLFGQLLVNFGQKKEIPFGEIAGIYVIATGVLIPCGFLIFDCFQTIYTGTPSSLELMGSKAALFMSVLLSISVAINVQLIRNQAKAREEHARKDKKARSDRDKLNHRSRECDAFKAAADKLKDMHPEIADQFWIFKQEARQEITDQYRQK